MIWWLLQWTGRTDPRRSTLPVFPERVGRMPQTIIIRGDGVAARCCLRLLAPPEFRLRAEMGVRPRLPAIMIGESTQKLVQDIFQSDELFTGLPRIRRRAVAWGKTGTMVLPHSAVIVPEQVLLDRLPCAASDGGNGDDATAAWCVLAARPLPEGLVEHQFGARTASAWKVRLAGSAEPETCWIESLDRGWLFLLPCGDATGWLLAVGEVVRSLLSQSRLVAAIIDDLQAEAGSFPCHPRIAEPVAEPGWMACGTGAIGFDPLCGDGCGYAAREAILVSAVVRAVAAGISAEAAVAHYRARLIAGFQRHLEVCRSFYTTGGTSDWWKVEADALEQGVAWCGRQLQAAGNFRFRLNGFDLEPVA